MNIKRWTLTLAAALTASAAVGCSDELAGPRSDLRDARATWSRTGPASYEYVYHELCFCAIVEPVRITVTEDRVTAASFVETGEPLSEDQVSWMPTVDDLFDRLEDVLGQDPVQYSVDFDPDMGYPSEASVDISRQIADEEFSFTAYDLVPAQGGS